MAVKPNLSFSDILQQTIERRAVESFLDKQPEARQKELDAEWGAPLSPEVARANEILGQYAAIAQFQNNILGLLPGIKNSGPPKPNRSIPTSIDPSYAVVPAALKYLRKLATKQAQSKPKTEKISLDSFVAIPSTFRYGEKPVDRSSTGSRNQIKVTLASKGVDPKAVASLREKIDYNTEKIKLGNEYVPFEDIKNLVQNFKFGTYDKAFTYSDLLDYIYKNRKFNKAVDISIAPYTLQRPSGKNEDKAEMLELFNRQKYSENFFDPKHGKGSYDPQHSVGASDIKKILPLIKSLYPEAEIVQGHRVSGAKQKSDKDDRIQIIKLPELTDTELLKYGAQAKQKLHRKISNTEQNAVLKFLFDINNSKKENTEEE
jgi:hypothetical protein